jgi:hypothetical protein
MREIFDMNFDLSIEYKFWESLSMPDVFVVNGNPSGGINISRLWKG